MNISREDKALFVVTGCLAVLAMVILLVAKEIAVPSHVIPAPKSLNRLAEATPPDATDKLRDAIIVAVDRYHAAAIRP